MITTHILDLSRGRPAGGVTVHLERSAAAAAAARLATAVTDEDGRIGDFGAGDLQAGAYRLRFEVGDWFDERGVDSFYPDVTVSFRIDAGEHYHVPLLLGPFGYSTYRGS